MRQRSDGSSTQRTGRRLGGLLTAWLAGGLLACAEHQPSDDGVPAATDMSRPPASPFENPDGCRGRACGERAPCDPGERCLGGVCLPDLGACTTGDQCSDDRRCYHGACVAYEECSRLAPFDGRCQGGVFPPDQFQQPEVACHLRDLDVMSTPVVADLDGDGRPEVVATGFPDVLVALRPGDCALRWKKSGLSLLSGGQAQVAVADLDADGRAEIVTLDAARRLVVFDHNGELRARSDVPVRERNPYDKDLWSAPTLADVDGAAPPEIIAGAQVARFVPGPPARIQVLWTQPNLSAYWGSVPVVADLDGDGAPEVVSSDRIYDGRTGADKTPEALGDRPFYAQVGDFTRDGEPDLLLIESEKDAQAVRVFDYARRRTVFGPYTTNLGGWGGPAVIADLDGDGVPEFGVASADRLTVYALRCAGRPKPPGCLGPEPGALWSRPIDDFSSGSAGVTALDLNGDGTPELVHRDECWLRILSGLDGHTLAARTIMSSTGLELPVLADADADGHADIVVASDVPNDDFGACMRVGRPEADTHTPWGGSGRGLLVLRDPRNRWVRTRPLWNQHAYHISNIADDRTVPIPTTAWWRGHNSFRLNRGEPPATGTTPPRPDLTGRFRKDGLSPDCRVSWRLSAQVCNRGAAEAAGTPGASVTFYDGDPRTGAPALCTASTASVLRPGECAELGCTWPAPQPGPRTLYLRVGDDGRGGRDTGQCSTDNDLAVWQQAGCVSQPG